MSRVTRRKHVLKEMMDDDLELPTEEQRIVRVVGSRGNNLLEVESPDLDVENFLVSMPNKYRRSVWVKRGDYILVTEIEEGDKVKGELDKILSSEHIKEYKRAGVWPPPFAQRLAVYPNDADEADEDEDLDYGGNKFTMRNINRPEVESPDETESDGSDSSDDEMDSGSESESCETSADCQSASGLCAMPQDKPCPQ